MVQNTRPAKGSFAEGRSQGDLGGARETNGLVRQSSPRLHLQWSKGRLVRAIMEKNFDMGRVKENARLVLAIQGWRVTMRVVVG